MYILHVKKKWAVTLLSGEGKWGDEELLNNWDFIYKQNSANRWRHVNRHEDVLTGHWGKETHGL